MILDLRKDMPEGNPLEKSSFNESPDMPKKLVLVPVEKLIPNIKPQVTNNLENVDYNSNNFGDSFMSDYVKRDFPKMLLEEEQSSPLDLQVFKDRYKGKIIIDLGAGDSWHGYLLSTFLEAKAYIGVEKFRSDVLKSQLSGITLEDITKYCVRNYNDPRKIGYGWKPAESTSLPEAAVVADDILNFLRRLPDKSVSIFAFGIDQFVFPGKNDSAELIKELERVLDAEGGYLEDNGFSPKNLTDLFKTLKNDPDEDLANLIGYNFASSDSPRIFIRPEDTRRSRAKYDKELKGIYKKREKEAEVIRKKFWEEKEKRDKK